MQIVHKQLAPILRQTSFISLQDLLQHFKGVGLTRRCTGLPILLDHLVDLRVLAEPLHCEVRAAAAAARWRDEDAAVSDCQIHQSHTLGQHVQWKKEHSSGTASGSAKRGGNERKTGQLAGDADPQHKVLIAHQRQKAKTRPIAALEDSLISSYQKHKRQLQKNSCGAAKKKKQMLSMEDVWNEYSC